MHNIEMYDYPENVNKKAVYSELNAHVEYEDRGEGGSLYNDIRWLDFTCKDYQSATEYLESHDRGDYDNLAVKYKDYSGIDMKLSKALETLKQRRTDIIAKKAEYAKQHSVSGFKSVFVGCPKCGSKINREYLRSEYCPVCREDLRGKTTLETLKRYDERLKEVEKAIREEEIKLKDKYEKKAKIRWLVKIEYHT